MKNPDDPRTRRIADLHVGDIARGVGSLADLLLRCIGIATAVWVWAILVETSLAATDWSEPEWLELALVAAVPIAVGAWLFLRGRPATRK